MMGTGEAEGENRAIRAAEAAINNPLLEDTSMSGARGLLINITGGDDLTLFEVDQAANRIREEVDEEANVIFGSAVDASLNGRIRVSVVATGIDSPRGERQRPPLTVVSGGAQGGVMGAPAPIVPAAIEEAAHADHEPAMATMTVGNTVRHFMPQPIVTPRMQAVVEADAVAETAQPASQAATLRQHQPAPAPRAELFGEVPRSISAPPAATQMVSPAPEAVGNKLFKAVTGVFRRGSAPTQASVAPAADRRAPVITPATPQVRDVHEQPATKDVGIEIPAFLRRQSS